MSIKSFLGTLNTNFCPIIVDNHLLAGDINLKISFSAEEISNQLFYYSRKSTSNNASLPSSPVHTLVSTELLYSFNTGKRRSGGNHNVHFLTFN